MPKEKSMYDIIKKQNGERFAKAIRNYDNGIFDVPEIDKIVKYAGRDAEPIMSYLVSLKDAKVQEYAVHMDPIKLLDMAGYDAYVVDTLEKQNVIKKYYAEHEKLCTFRDPNRFKDYYIINAVRKDVDKIRRENFHNPKREDEYGTSVLSIQILKSGGFISIKNRYNHTVINPDNTFNSNPDNIIPGLGDAIKHYFNVDFSAIKTKLVEGYIVVGKQIIKYNDELNNVYFGDRFYVKDGRIFELNGQYEYMIDCGVVLDMRDRSVKDISGRYRNVVFIENEIKGRKLQITRMDNGEFALIADGKKVVGFKDGQMTYLCLYNKLQVANVGKSGYKMRGELDFSNVTVLDLSGGNLNDVTSIKFNPNGQSIDLKDVQGLRGDLDFSGVEYLCLDCDLSGVTSIKFNPNAQMLELSLLGYEGAEIDYDFSNVNELFFGYNDFTGMYPKFNPNSESINLDYARGLSGNLDFSGVNALTLYGVDFSNVTSIKFNPNAESIVLLDTVGLRGDLDFSNVENLMIMGADLSNVTSIKLNPNGRIDDAVARTLQQVEKNKRISGFKNATKAVKEKGQRKTQINAPINQAQGNDNDKD